MTGISIAIIVAVISVLLYKYVFKDEEPEEEGRMHPKQELGDVDQELTPQEDVDFDIDSIPEEDQEYLVPVLSKLVQEYIPIKVRYPSNALLIDHLGKALGDAAESFEKREKKTDKAQTGNEDWLKVAAWAMRLYKEGTVHNSIATRERFNMVANLSSRELKSYATATMNQAGKKIHKELEGEDPEEPQTRDEKAPDVGNDMQPYTPSEIEDMKNAANEDRDNDNDDDRIIKP